MESTTILSVISERERERENLPRRIQSVSIFRYRGDTVVAFPSAGGTLTLTCDQLFAGAREKPTRDVAREPRIRVAYSASSFGKPPVDDLRGKIEARGRASSRFPSSCARPFPRSLVHREITLSRDRFLERKRVAVRDTRAITRASIGNRVFLTDTLLLEGRESCVNLSRLLVKGILQKQ